MPRMYTHMNGDSGRELVRMTLKQARSCAGSGEQSAKVAALMPHVQWIGSREDLADNLYRYGAWTRDELAAMSDDEIKTKALWVACCDIAEDSKPYRD